ncbi:MAG: HEAT repeat domain-containing protein [Cyanothece sp. SIO1E1]|nr:HEAT repeat domain-containing protein [Cyanothece sp. SIO1E1]
MHDDDLTVLKVEGEQGSHSEQSQALDTEIEEPKPEPEEMLPLLTAPEPQKRMLAARAFCELQDERSILPLIHLLSDVCPLIRVSAAYALGRNPSPDAVEPLIAQLNSDWNGYVRKGVVWALGNCRDRRSLAPLIDALQTEISAVRLWAASALAQMANVEDEIVVEAIPPLIGALTREPIAAIRSNCAWALGQLCRELPSNEAYTDAIAALLKTFAEDEDVGVREDAKAAILKVGDPHGLQAIEEMELEGLI